MECLKNTIIGTHPRPRGGYGPHDPSSPGFVLSHKGWGRGCINLEFHVSFHSTSSRFSLNLPPRSTQGLLGSVSYYFFLRLPIHRLFRYVIRISPSTSPLLCKETKVFTVRQLLVLHTVLAQHGLLTNNSLLLRGRFEPVDLPSTLTFFFLF